MNMKRRNDTKSPLVSIIVEGGDITLSPNSVDMQIDSLLVSFEDDSEAVNQDVQPTIPEGTSIRAALRRLTEDAPITDGEDDTTTTSGEQKTDQPALPMTPKLNIDEFTQKVAMLIQTYSKRLDVETAIFNRAKNYLSQNHDDDAAKQLEELLVNEHGIDLRGEVHDEPRETFPAFGAGPSL